MLEPHQACIPAHRSSHCWHHAREVRWTPPLMSFRPPDGPSKAHTKVMRTRPADVQACASGPTVARCFTSGTPDNPAELSGRRREAGRMFTSCKIRELPSQKLGTGPAGPWNGCSRGGNDGGRLARFTTPMKYQIISSGRYVRRTIACGISCCWLSNLYDDRGSSSLTNVGY